MNAICAPLLYAMPEVDAYYAFANLITSKIPLYWLSDVAGAEAGCKVMFAATLAWLQVNDSLCCWCAAGGRGAGHCRSYAGEASEGQRQFVRVCLRVLM
jgi:hypothetical protein